MYFPLLAPLEDSREWDECDGRRTNPTTNDCDPIRHLGVHAAVRPIAGQADLPALIVALLRADLEPGAAVWLDEAQRFFNGQHGGDVAHALHRMLDLAPQPEPKRVVTGSFWPSELWLSPDDDNEQAVRDLLARPGITVPVCEAFPFPESVERAAQQHPRWRDALATNGGVNLVQFLTGGPSLVRALEKGRYGADASALLAAAISAHRIGFWSPLPVAMLAQAASEHRRPRQGAPNVDLAAADAMEPVCGVRALTHAVGHEHAVMLHNYLAQHTREARRREAIPDMTQLLYRRGDEAAAVELRQRAAAGDHNAARLLVCMLHERGSQDACAELRELTHAGDRFAAEHLVELLCERGDPESLDEVRERVNAGDGYAATLLVELLVERGDHDAVVELRALSETGDRYATELLVAMGDRATADVVRARARSGDRTAVDLVVERLVDPGDPAAVAELQTYSAAGNGYATELLIRVLFNLGDESAAMALRAYAEYGNDYAAVLLVRLLFDRGDQKAVEELRARSDAGDRYAGQRLVELLAGRQDPKAIAELRTRAEGGDWYSSQQLAETLAENGDPAAVAELRARSDAGDHYASERLVELLTGRGDPEAVSELQGRADAGDHRAAQALAYLLLQRGDEHGLRAEVNAGNTADAACALANLLEGWRTTQDGEAATTKGSACCGTP